MKYILTKTARDVLVGLIDKDSAEDDINLSHNLFNSHVNHNYYHGVINFNSISKFYRFLINKYMLLDWDSNKSFSQLLKQSTNKARQVLNNEVEHFDFFNEVYQYNYKTATKYKWHHPKYSD